MTAREKRWIIILAVLIWVLVGGTGCSRLDVIRAVVDAGFEANRAWAEKTRRAEVPPADVAKAAEQNAEQWRLLHRAICGPLPKNEVPLVGLNSEGLLRMMTELTAALRGADREAIGSGFQAELRKAIAQHEAAVRRLKTLELNLKEGTSDNLAGATPGKEKP